MSASFTAAQGSESETVGKPDVLADLVSVSDDIFVRWDKDMRSGKLLSALAGNIERYDPRVTRVRTALAAAPELLAATRKTVAAFAHAPDEVIEGAFGVDVMRGLRDLRAAIARAEGRPSPQSLTSGRSDLDAV